MTWQIRYIHGIYSAVINRIRSLSRKKFVRNVTIVATGTAGAQAITMGFAPLITRLYGPEAFGILGAFTALLAVLTPIAALSYPIAIVLPKRDVDAVGLAKLSIRIALATSLITALMLWIFKGSIVRILNLQDVEPFIMLLPFAMFFSAAMAIMSQWLIRKKHFRVTAKVAVLQALWLNSLKAGVGLFTPVAAVLVALATLGSALHALMLWMGARWSPGGRLSVASEEVASSCKNLASQHKDFAYYRTPQIILNAASQSMPVLMLTSFFGPAAAGFYALGKMVLAAPTSLLGQSVGTVFYPHFNETVLSGRSGAKLLVKATMTLSLVGVWPFLFIFAFGPAIFAFLFGMEWAEAGQYARWLALWTFVGFINRPSVAAIPVLKLQGVFLLYEMASVLLRAAALYTGFKLFGTALAAVISFSLISMLLNACLIGFVILMSRGIKVDNYE